MRSAPAWVSPALYDSYKAGDTAYQPFFEREYALDQTIHDYLKPVLALMNGIVMGGGIGLHQRPRTTGDARNRHRLLPRYYPDNRETPGARH